MARTPNEMPGRPVGTVVPTWSGNDDAADRVERQRASAEWRRRHPSRWRRWFRRSPRTD